MRSIRLAQLGFVYQFCLVMEVFKINTNHAEGCGANSRYFISFFFLSYFILFYFILFYFIPLLFHFIAFSLQNNIQ